MDMMPIIVLVEIWETRRLLGFLCFLELRFCPFCFFLIGLRMADRPNKIHSFLHFHHNQQHICMGAGVVCRKVGWKDLSLPAVLVYMEQPLNMGWVNKTLRWRPRFKILAGYINLGKFSLESHFLSHKNTCCNTFVCKDPLSELQI